MLRSPTGAPYWGALAEQGRPVKAPAVTGAPCSCRESAGLRRVGASGRVGGPEVGGRVLAGQGGPKLLSPLSPSRHPLRQGLRRLVAPPPQQEPRQRHRDQ